ncbi:alginate lyase family protein [Mucilaginibacter ginsenosidivorans]|uniref:Heparinase n=1 Tax=Mucilaginibacter ginsenosidivorans TaxID=398053 RepID=A0A5B8V315_9SPHI|nr:alginate lyase family protein [Mucilaginibacter ginsenosidivorans]QEC65081.1 heparinase [Mucilaginibacter ginsenosidivorans]
MFAKVQRAGQLIGNMGWRYIFFRLGFELKKRTGIHKKAFPVRPAHETFLSLDEWRRDYVPFFFRSKGEIDFTLPLSKELEKEHAQISAYNFTFFSSLEYELGADYDWLTNPDTGYSYNGTAHWTDINDYNQAAGDIKFVWEPSRFSHLYTLIRFDKHSGVDCSAQVFDEISNWINANAINQGPNFKCSQEISLRMMNWIFALYYYRNSPTLTNELFDEIQHYIFWQTRHVYDNINFSRIAVRNNHAITETLALYIVGLLFPQLPGAAKWKKDGKRWFEEEIAYQVYEDGTFLQFSMNYHRVVVQLMTWAIRLAGLNNERFDEVVYDRAKKSLQFLTAAMDETTGWLPNYGANDGALFFKLSDNHFRDYRPQLEALSNVLGVKWPYGHFEDSDWYGLKPFESSERLAVPPGYRSFNKGGYHIYRSADSMSFVRCGNHKDRPSQADNLHLDVWHKGINILHDAGSYKYNADQSDLKYFMGSRSHNTVMLDDYDQMEKGARFIWYYWTQCESVKTSETDDHFFFEGIIKAFQYINKNIRHTRKITVHKKAFVWEVEDTIDNKPPEMMLTQLWHTCYPGMLKFESSTALHEALKPSVGAGYYSSFYGKKEKCTEIAFATNENRVATRITVI